MDPRILDLAREQHWVVSRRQLLQLGITVDAITWMLHRGDLRPLHRGVYLVGHEVPPPLALESAALVSMGNRALLSHQTAAYLDKLLPHPAQPVHVTVVGRAVAARPQLHIHHATTLARRDTRTRDGLRLTTIHRTILDLAAKMGLDELEQLVAEAVRRRRTNERALRDQLQRNPGRPGTRSLRAVLDGPGGPAFTRSKAERLLRRLLRDAQLPQPQSCAMVGPFEVDLLWADERLVVEFDSARFHSDRLAFETDRRRDSYLQSRGYAVVRITWRRLTREPHAVVALIARMLERRAVAA